MATSDEGLDGAARGEKNGFNPLRTQEKKRISFLRSLFLTCLEMRYYVALKRYNLLARENFISSAAGRNVFLLKTIFSKGRKKYRRPDNIFSRLK